MFVAIIQVELRLHEPRTLKERRRIVNSLKERVHRRFKVAIAEVGDTSVYRSAQLGISLVSNEARHARERAQKVVEFIENAPDSEVVDVQTEVI
ncbi:MAG: hypothetical protein CMJ83_06775 [Planctomycetes bacterium]|nr:hypothetical protein [Planctomycetota bacterium]